MGEQSCILAGYRRFGFRRASVFLAKAEIENWPILGKLAKGGGTLFIKRGSGDSVRIREQITDFLKQNIPVLFFLKQPHLMDAQLKIYGRILGAAIEAQRPVQICLICYVNQQGELDMVAPFIGNISFAKHVQNVLEMPKVTAHLMALPAIATEGHTVESLTALVHENMLEGLQRLQAKVLKSLIKRLFIRNIQRYSLHKTFDREYRQEFY